MMSPMVLALALVTFGNLFAGIAIGRKSIIRRFETAHRLVDGDSWSATWTILGISFLTIGCVLGLLILAYPAERLADHAKQVRSQYTTEQAP